MSALISIEHIVIHRLESHLETSDSSAAPHATVLIGHIFRSCFNRQSYNAVSSGLIDLN